MDWRSRISINPEVCHGKPVITGTRVLVSTLLDNLAAGESADAIAANFHITKDDIMAALYFVAMHESPDDPDRAA